jgi:hypothetical protein
MPRPVGPFFAPVPDGILKFRGAGAIWIAIPPDAAPPSLPRPFPGQSRHLSLSCTRQMPTHTPRNDQWHSRFTR